MKAKAVSVSRYTRGLPAGMRRAFSNVVELASQTTQKRKTNTMKDYILRTEAAVEPQMTSTSQRADTTRASVTRPRGAPSATSTKRHGARERMVTRQLAHLRRSE
jgi:hypothetical protein